MPPVATTPADTPPPITQPSGPPPPAGPPDIGFTDPTTGFTSTSGVAPVGSPQWYAQLGSNTSNIEEMVETATGLNVTEDWMEDYGTMLPTYDPTGETFAQADYAVAGERYGLAGKAYETSGEAFGLAKEGYQFELGDIFGQAGTGTMDLLSSWGGGGATMTGRKRRQRKGIGATTERAAGGAKRKLGAAGLQYDIAGQTYEGAGISYAQAGVTKASEIYDIRTDFADKFSAAISDLASDEAFVGLNPLGNININYGDTDTTATWSDPNPTQMVWDSNSNTYVNPNAVDVPLPLGP